MGASWLFLGVTVALLAALGAIAVRVYRRGGTHDGEQPKYRMLDDD